MTTACCPRCRIPLNAVQMLIAIRAGSCIDCARTSQPVVTGAPKKKRPAKRPAGKKPPLPAAVARVVADRKPPRLKNEQRRKSPALSLSGVLTKRTSMIRRLPYLEPTTPPAEPPPYVNEGLAAPAAPRSFSDARDDTVDPAESHWNDPGYEA